MHAINPTSQADFLQPTANIANPLTAILCDAWKANCKRIDKHHQRDQPYCANSVRDEFEGWLNGYADCSIATGNAMAAEDISYLPILWRYRCNVSAPQYQTLDNQP